jgi:hypothetical protein
MHSIVSRRPLRPLSQWHSSLRARRIPRPEFGQWPANQPTLYTEFDRPRPTRETVGRLSVGGQDQRHGEGNISTKTGLGDLEFERQHRHYNINNGTRSSSA